MCLSVYIDRPHGSFQGKGCISCWCLKHRLIIALLLYIKPIAAKGLHYEQASKQSKSFTNDNILHFLNHETSSRFPLRSLKERSSQSSTNIGTQNAFSEFLDLQQFKYPQGSNREAQIL